GAPPVSAARASVPAQTPGWFERQSVAIAISPEGEIDSRFALGSSSGSESGLDGCLSDSLSGLASQLALYTIVWPSGAKRAGPVVPLPNVICWYDGVAARPSLRCRSIPAPSAARMARAVSAGRQRLRRGALTATDGVPPDTSPVTGASERCSRTPRTSRARSRVEA